MTGAALTCMSGWIAWRALPLAIAMLPFVAPQICIASGHGHSAPSDAEEDNVESPTGFRGIELGEFSVRTYRSVSGQKNRVQFRLYATIKNEHVKGFRKLYKHRKHKIRDQVIVAARLTPVEDYDDPELTKLRRRIRLRIRRMMPELAIEEILVSDFSLTIQSK